MIDLDDICVTNVNRQIHAVTPAIGALKVEAMARRVQEINPGCKIHGVAEFFTGANSARLLGGGFDCVLDAIDNLHNKCALIAGCREQTIPMVTTGGAGGRTDPTRIRIDDLTRVTHDPLIRQVRKTLRREHGFPVDRSSIFGVPCVYSTEPIRYPWSDGTVCDVKEPGDENLRMDCNGGYGSVTHLTGAFGFAAAGEVIKLLVSAGA